MVSDWLAALVQGLEHQPALVRVMVLATRGSAPREAGAWMLVSADTSIGTIGGGHLEWQAEAIARDMLAHQTTPAQRRVQRFSLGATLGQCCGGVVELWFEYFSASERAQLQTLQAAVTSGTVRFLLTPLQRGPRRSLSEADLPPSVQALFSSKSHAPHLQVLRTPEGVQSDESACLIEDLQPALSPLWLYGAGHVGQALVRVLAELPVHITWIDSRNDLLMATDKVTHKTTPSSLVIAHVTAYVSEQPADEVADAPANTLHLVMTHRHDLDYAICRALLRHGRFAWAGMIGSETKAASFRARLQREGYSPAQIARIVSPIGIGGIGGMQKGHNKTPAAIAITVAAQILQVLELAGESQTHATQPTDPYTDTNNATNAKAHR